MRKIVSLIQWEDLNVWHKDDIPAWGYMIYFCRIVGLDLDSHNAADGYNICVEVHYAE
jgi:hypothetical protein